MADNSQHLGRGVMNAENGNNSYDELSGQHASMKKGKTVMVAKAANASKSKKKLKSKSKGKSKNSEAKPTVAAKVASGGSVYAPEKQFLAEVCKYGVNANESGRINACKHTIDDILRLPRSEESYPLTLKGQGWYGWDLSVVLIPSLGGSKADDGSHDVTFSRPIEMNRLIPALDAFNDLHAKFVINGLLPQCDIFKQQVEYEMKFYFDLYVRRSRSRDEWVAGFEMWHNRINTLPSKPLLQQDPIFNRPGGPSIARKIGFEPSQDGNSYVCNEVATLWYDALKKIEKNKYFFVYLQEPRMAPIALECVRRAVEYTEQEAKERKAEIVKPFKKVVEGCDEHDAFIFARIDLNDYDFRKPDVENVSYVLRQGFYRRDKGKKGVFVLQGLRPSAPFVEILREACNRAEEEKSDENDADVVPTNATGEGGNKLDENIDFSDVAAFDPVQQLKKDKLEEEDFDMDEIEGLPQSDALETISPLDTKRLNIGTPREQMGNIADEDQMDLDKNKNNSNSPSKSASSRYSRSGGVQKRKERQG